MYCQKAPVVVLENSYCCTGIGLLFLHLEKAAAVVLAEASCGCTGRRHPFAVLAEANSCYNCISQFLLYWLKAAVVVLVNGS